MIRIMEDIAQVSCFYSYLANCILLGDVEAVKWLYGNAWKESPPLTRTISTLQEILTADVIEKDTEGIYSNEFLYYWGMINIGELSKLIVKDLEAAESCFSKIKEVCPKVRSRLAFIGLLNTDEPAKSDVNVARSNIIQQWAGKQDIFSIIIIAKILFFKYLEEGQADNGELPIRLCRLLALPCQKGHPVAIRFWNEVIDYINPLSGTDMRIDESRINGDILYDFYV